MAPRMPHVYLIRHGQTEWSVNGRHTGTTDIPLTDAGVAIVKRVAGKIVPDIVDPRKVSHVLVSPRKRAQVTADLLFNSQDKDCFHSFEIDEDVAEWDYGAYEGLLSSEIAKISPGWSIWKDGCPPSEEHPGGESVQQMQDRVDRVIKKIKDVHAAALARGDRDGASQDVVIFSHGHFTRCFIARWMNMPLSAGYNFSSDPCSLHTLGYQHGRMEEASLIGLNWFTEERT